MDPLPHDVSTRQTEPARPGTRRGYQLIVFRLGGQEYALVIDQIEEVVITPVVSRIPLTPKYIKGIANVRGSILAVLDLEERFGLAPAEEAGATPAPNYLLVIAGEALRVGILVREVPHTLTVPEADVDLAPGLLAGDGSAGNGSIRGIVRSGSRIILLIDVFEVIAKEHLPPLLPATVA